LNLGPGAFFGDRISRMQKRDEPIELNTEDFAQVLLVFGEKTPWALVGSPNFNIGSSKVAPVGRFAAPIRRPGPTTRSGCVSERHSLGLETRDRARLFTTRGKGIFARRTASTNLPSVAASSRVRPRDGGQLRVSAPRAGVVTGIDWQIQLKRVRLLERLR
jgi:hypothetical protein